jgi:hypothetical protein
VLLTIEALELGVCYLRLQGTLFVRVGATAFGQAKRDCPPHLNLSTPFSKFYHKSTFNLKLFKFKIEYYLLSSSPLHKP